MVLSNQLSFSRGVTKRANSPFFNFPTRPEATAIFIKPCQPTNRTDNSTHRRHSEKITLYRRSIQPETTNTVPSQPSNVVSHLPSQLWPLRTMAKPSKSDRTYSNSNPHASYAVGLAAPVMASCYVVDANNMALKGFHYSTTGAGGRCIHSRQLVFFGQPYAMLDS